MTYFKCKECPLWKINHCDTIKEALEKINKKKQTTKSIVKKFKYNSDELL